ncbi:MAG: DUF2887 domain-containing protein [Cyanobium sp.]
MVASDKLFYWLFQEHPERIQPFVASLLPRMEGYTFSAPVLKEREYRLGGLFVPPADQPDQPALILEAQMEARPKFLLRLYAESARLLQQRQRQGQPIRHWRVLVICPSRTLHFGDPLPVQEFLDVRVQWIELLPEHLPPSPPPLQRALTMLLLPEDQLPACSAAIRNQAQGSDLAAGIDDVSAAILLSHFSGRSITDICAMGGLTTSEFTGSVAYREIYGLGHQEGHQEGRRSEAVALILRLLQRRFGAITPDQLARIDSLPLARLETLAEDLLAFQSPADLTAWLSHQHG